MALTWIAVTAVGESGGVLRRPHWEKGVLRHLDRSFRFSSVNARRSLASNMGLAIKLSGLKPDVIHLSTCLVNAKPGCPYSNAEDISKAVEDKTGVKVVVGTHDYH